MAGFEGRGLTKSRSLGMTVPRHLYFRVSKRRMQAVANVSIGAMFCMYALTATFGYLTFYSEWDRGQGWEGAGVGTGPTAGAGA